MALGSINKRYSKNLVKRDEFVNARRFNNNNKKIEMNFAAFTLI